MLILFAPPQYSDTSPRHGMLQPLSGDAPLTTAWPFAIEFPQKHSGKMSADHIIDTVNLET